MIILLQSVTTQFRRLFSHISYCKKEQNSFIKKCDRLLLQSASGITECDSYHKVIRNMMIKIRKVCVCVYMLVRVRELFYRKVSVDIAFANNQRKKSQPVKLLFKEINFNSVSPKKKKEICNSLFLKN